MAKHKRQRSHHVFFQTQLGMGIIRRDIAITNALVNRKEITDLKSTKMIICGCGTPGCTLTINIEKHEKEKDSKN